MSEVPLKPSSTVPGAERPDINRSDRTEKTLRVTSLSKQRLFRSRSVKIILFIIQLKVVNYTNFFLILYRRGFSRRVDKLIITSYNMYK